MLRSGTIAFLFGVLALQCLSELPNVWFASLILLLVSLLLYLPALRAPICFALGFLWALWRAGLVLSGGLPTEIEGEPVTVEGRVAGLPREVDHGIRFDFEVTTVEGLRREWPTPGRVRLNWYQQAPKLAPGEFWRLIVRLKRPYGFRNPGGFDYEGWLFQHKIRATGYVMSSHYNRPIWQANGEWINRLRQRLAHKLTEALGKASQGGLVIALAIGEQHGISQEQWRVLTRTGTSHLVAISGLHIGLVAGFAYFLGRWLWSLSGFTVLYVAAPRVGACTALLAALVYSALAGFAIPTQRTLIMIAAVMVGVFVDRRIAPLDLLMLALLLVLVVDPFAVMAAGFWLSFAAVAFILYGMAGRIAPANLWWTFGRVHVVVAIGLTPLLLSLFGQNPILGPLANLVAVPWVSFVVVPLVLLGTLLVVMFEPIGGMLLSVAVQALEWLWPYLQWIASLEFASWDRPMPDLWVAAAASIGVLILLLPRGIPGRWTGLVWLLPLVCAKPPQPVEGEFWFTLLDVGQGLAAVIQTKDHVLVYDTGPRFSENFDTGQAVVVPYLRHHSIAHVDTVVISHGDNDHIGGLASLLDNMAVARIITSVPEAIEHRQVDPCADGQRWRWNEVEFKVLHPPAGRTGRDNDQSCVLKISVGEHAVLLPGDIERIAETWLVQAHAEDLRAQILVAPHHGSKSSSSPAFIAAVDPDYVLFPVGYRNRFEFPNAEVRARYTERGVVALNVAEEGAIQVRIGDRIALAEVYRHMRSRYWHTR